MELIVIVVIIFVIYGAGWIWQTIHDVIRDINRSNWDNRVYGQVASPRSIRKTLGGHDLGKLRKVYARVAELYDGQSHNRQLFESPKVSFHHQGSRVLLSIYESSDDVPKFYTQLTFTVPQGWSNRLELFPQRFAESDVKYLNVDDIRIGDAEFDPRYVIKSNDEKFAREFLDARTRQAVEDLRNLLRNDKILISLNGSRLLVRKHSILWEFSDLTALAELSFRIHDRIVLFAQRESGIEIMEEAPEGGPEGETDSPVCQVCGFPIEKPVRIFCRRCRTPHHKDCWEFNQQCSTFACGETRFSNTY